MRQRCNDKEAFLRCPHKCGHCFYFNVDEDYDVDLELIGYNPHNSPVQTNRRKLDEVNLLQDLPTDIIYFDFAKAFDTVIHDLILIKLKYHYSIDGRMLKFFKSYLSNHTQRVVLDNCTSDIIDVLSGVLQGSYWDHFCLFFS